MKRKTFNFAIFFVALGAGCILFSAPLGFRFLNAVFSGKNLAGEYHVLLAGSITGVRWLGVLSVFVGHTIYQSRRRLSVSE